MDTPHYSAFLSYSHADTRSAELLHRALETYRIPKKLVGTVTDLGPVQRRLRPVFRDREELPASGDLGQELRESLAAAEHLIVIASPAAARSRWVNEEILAFKRLHGGEQVLVLIVAGEPGDPEQECFPPALRFRLGPDGELTDTPTEPIAADVRAGGDGRRLALLKLVAGMTGLPLDALVRRDAARRQRRLAWIASATSAAFLVTLLLALYANTQRVEAERQRIAADQQRRTAEASLEFLIGTFELANPATENPRTITALTVLQRGSAKMDDVLRGEPAARARLLRTIGEIYSNLGLPTEAERDMRRALALTPPRSESRATTLMELSLLALRRGDLRAGSRYLDEAAVSFDPDLDSSRLLVAKMAALRGRLARLSFNSDEALRALDDALARYEQLPGDHRREIARILMEQGQALVALKQHDRASVALRRAEAVYLSRYGPDHVLTATATQNRALAEFEAGRLAEAERLIARAVANYSRAYEPQHPTLAYAAVLQGRIAHAKGDLVMATNAFGRAASIFERLYGTSNSQTGDARYYEARVWSDRGEPDVALRLLEQTKRAYDASYGPLDPDQAELLATRAQVLRTAGRVEEAERDCDAEIALRRQLKDVALAAAQQRCRALVADPPLVSLRFQ